jgi:hypothetical protein
MSAVYFAKVGEFVKIGFASNPHQRMKSLFTQSRLIVPEGLDKTQPINLVLVIPFCRMRDERNLHLLFARHWTGAGEWFHWSPAFEEQMRGMEFITHATRLKHLREARKALGVGGSHVKHERWGKQTPELLADLQSSA